MSLLREKYHWKLESGSLNAMFGHPTLRFRNTEHKLGIEKAHRSIQDVGL